MKAYPTTLPGSQQGVALLEALIAVLIFSLGLLALTGLQAAMIKNTDDAKYRAEAAFIAQQKLSEIWLNEDGNANIAGYITTDSAIAQLPNGTISVAVAADNSCVVTVTVNWNQPGGSGAHSHMVEGVVQGVNWCT